MKFITQLFRGRMFGHPIHLMLVHFPSALFPGSLIFEIISFHTGRELFSILATYMIIMALGFGLTAMVFGFIDLNRIDAKDRAWKVAVKHAGLNILWLLLFTTILILKLKYASNGILIISLSILVNGGLIYSNFLGGELVLNHGIGKK